MSTRVTHVCDSELCSNEAAETGSWFIVETFGALYGEYCSAQCAYDHFGYVVNKLKGGDGK